MKTLEEKKAKLAEEFSQFNQWEDRYRHLIQKGKLLEPLTVDERQDINLIKGCQSQVWLIGLPQGRDRLILKADSDAAIVKGLVALLVELYSGVTFQEAKAASADILDILQLKNHLSLNRTNGLVAMIKQISFYGLAYEHKFKETPHA